MHRQTFIDPSLDQTFQQDGFVVLDLLSELDVIRLREMFQTVESYHDGGFSASILTDNLPMRKRVDTYIAPFLREKIAPVLHDFRTVLGSYAIKNPRSDYGSVGLHQDITFVDETLGPAALSIWAPLVDVHRDNGCMGVFPGSHRLNDNFRDPTGNPYPELQGILEDECLEWLEMRPGEVLIMDSRVLHMSARNTTDVKRVVAAGVMLPAEMPMIFCFYNPERTGDCLEVFSVADDFLLRHSIGMRPIEGELTRIVPHQVTPLDEAGLRAFMADHALSPTV